MSAMASWIWPFFVFFLARKKRQEQEEAKTPELRRWMLCLFGFLKGRRGDLQKVGHARRNPG